MHRSVSVLEPLQDRLRPGVICLCMADSYYTNGCDDLSVLPEYAFQFGSHIPASEKSLCVFLFSLGAVLWKACPDPRERDVGHSRVLPGLLQHVSLVCELG